MAFHKPPADMLILPPGGHIVQYQMATAPKKGTSYENI